MLVAAIACLIGFAGPAQAQFGAGPIRPAGFRGAGIPISNGPGVRGNGFVWGTGSRPIYLLPLGIPMFPLTSFGWLGLVPPAAIGRPTVVVLPVIILSDSGNDNPPLQPGNPGPPPGEDDFPPGAKQGDMFVIRPKKALPLLPPPDAPRPERVGPPPPLPLPALKDPFADRKMVNIEIPDPNPVKEVARLMKLGKDAFAAGEFGAASEQFDRAIAIAPREALPVFLKAQAAFAAGRYSDAVTAIRKGLDLDRTWPNSPFDPKELYGANPNVFNEHLGSLRTVIAAKPREPTLEFLLGYELWFIGEKTEAKKWFELAEKHLPAAGPIALFK
jgi:hypothetical protein